VRGGVFVCHASKDAAVAQQVVAAMEAAGLPCWIAPRDIRAGENYAQAILDGLAAAPAVVLLFSSATNASPHVQRELETAVDAGSPIIPVRLADVQPSPPLRYFIGTSQWLDTVGTPSQTWEPLLVEAARRAAGGAEAAGHEKAGRPAMPSSQPVQPRTRTRWMVLAAVSVAVLAIAGVAGVLAARDHPERSGPDAAPTTNQSSPTESSASEPAAQPSASVGETEVVAEDHFDDPRTNFTLGEFPSNHGHMTAAVQDGALVLRVEGTGDGWKSWTGTTVPKLGKVWSVRATAIANPTDRSCGLWVGDSTRVLTVVLDRSSGAGEINVHRDGQTLYSQVFDAAPGSQGLLALVGDGGEMRVTIGDQQLATVTITDLGPVVQAGVAAMGDTATCVFDDFVVERSR
jgi:hypothetical protein